MSDTTQPAEPQSLDGGRTDPKFMKSGFVPGLLTFSGSCLIVLAIIFFLIAADDDLYGLAGLAIPMMGLGLSSAIAGLFFFGMAGIANRLAQLVWLHSTPEHRVALGVAETPSPYN